MFTLEILKKINDGTLDAANRKDIAAAAPLIDRYTKHQDPVVIEALFQERLKQARDSKGAKGERDTYWNLIGHLRIPLGINPLTLWLLDKIETNPHAPHTEEEIQAYREDIKSHKNHVDREPPVEPPSSYTHEHTLYAMMKSAVIAGMPDIAERAAKLIKAHYRADFRSTLQYNHGRVLNLKSEDRVDHNYPATPQDIRRAMRTAAKIDAILGTQNTAREFIKVALPHALLPDTPATMRDFIMREAARLPVPHKRELIEDYAYLPGSRNEDSICGVVDKKWWISIFFESDKDYFDKWRSMLASWSKQDTSQDYVHFFARTSLKSLNPYGGSQDYSDGIFSIHDFERKFSPQLKWAEVKRRIDILREITGQEMQPVDFSVDTYLQCALTRAVKFGHADDLRDAMTYCLSLSPEEQEARGFEHGFPRGFPGEYRYDRISRDPETMQVLFDLLPDARWLKDGGYRGNIISRVLSISVPRSDHDEFEHALFSAVANGKAMPKSAITAYYPQAFQKLDALLETASPEDRESVLGEIFSNKRRSPYQKSIQACRYYEDESPIAPWISSIYKHHDKATAAKLMEPLLYEAAAYMYTCRQLDSTAKMLSVLKEHDPDLYQIHIQKMKDKDGYSRSIEPALLLTLCNEDIPANWKYPDLEFIPAFIKDMPVRDVSINERLDQCKVAAGHLSRNYNPHMNSTLRNELLPLLYIIEQLEGNNAASDNAGKLAQLFVSFRKADSFIRQHAQPGRQPVHDLCLFSLPANDNWTKEIWGNLAIRYGNAVTKYLGFAPQIEAYVEEHNQKRRAVNRDTLGKTGAKINDRTLNLTELKPAMIRAIVNRVGYERAHENKQAADFCLRLGVMPHHFDETLKLLTEFNTAAKHPKDRMPNVAVNGDALSLTGHTMSKVPRGDIMNLWVGKMVNCCNHLDGAGSDMARAQFQGGNNALYVIRDARNRPEAKLSGWRSKEGSFVFNAWERLSDEQDYLMTRFVLAAGLQIMKENPRIKEVRMGAGPIKRDMVPFNLAAQAHTPKNEDAWTDDSKTQFSIVRRGHLKEAEQLLKDEIERLKDAEKVRIRMTWAEFREQEYNAA